MTITLPKKAATLPKSNPTFEVALKQAISEPKSLKAKACLGCLGWMAQKGRPWLGVLSVGSWWVSWWGSWWFWSLKSFSAKTKSPPQD